MPIPTQAKRRVRSQVGDTGLAVHVGGDGLENRPHLFVGLPGAAGHQAGAVAGAMFAPRDADPQVEKALLGQGLGPQVRVLEVRVATVNDQITRSQMGQQVPDHGIHRRACWYQQHHCSRGAEQPSKLVQTLRSPNVAVRSLCL